MFPCQDFIDQEPDKLNLSVTPELDINQFQVIASRRGHLGGMEVELNVIGASHVIVFKTPYGELYEVLACSDLPGSLAITEIAHPVEYFFGNTHYCFTVNSFPWQEPEPFVLKNMVRQAKEADRFAGLGLIQEFPKGTLTVAPKTVILGYSDIENEKGSAVLYTAHSYPGKGVVVSRSTISQRRARL